jgi:hypothetical protein
MFSKHLSFADRTSEIAFAVIMVIIINGYVALSDLNTGFVYIVAVNLGASAIWGIIDGLIYAISSSIERNNMRNKLSQLKTCVNCENSIDQVKKGLDDTFLESFDEKGKEAIAKEIITHVPNASLEEGKVITKAEALGWLSIIGIYLVVGFFLALPFLVLQHKVFAWLISNAAGVAWLFWYGIQLGKSSGKNHLLLGLLMATISIIFLAISYLVWAR